MTEQAENYDNEELEARIANDISSQIAMITFARVFSHAHIDAVFPMIREMLAQIYPEPVLDAVLNVFLNAAHGTRKNFEPQESSVIITPK